MTTHLSVIRYVTVLCILLNDLGFKKVLVLGSIQLALAQFIRVFF